MRPIEATIVLPFILRTKVLNSYPYAYEKSWLYTVDAVRADRLALVADTRVETIRLDARNH